MALNMDWNAGVQRTLAGLNGSGDYLAPLALRLLLAVEFGSAGLEKWRGENWFADIQHQFPFPFNVIDPDISWALATGFEVVGAAALIMGLGVRFFSLSLMVLTVVAIAAVHWPAEWHSLADLIRGYAISDEGYGNYKLPLIYLLMFVPLLLQGGGRLSLDRLLWRRWLATRP